MSEILSQSEMEALLSNVITDEPIRKKHSVKAVHHGIDKRLQKYDFRRPFRISKEELRFLNFFFDRYTRNLSSSLSASLRMDTEVHVTKVEQIIYDEFIGSLPDPSCISIVKMRSMEGKVAIQMDPSIVFPIIDRLLGGSGQPLDVVRNVTDIEQQVLESVIMIILNRLEVAWQPSMNLKIELLRHETNPELIQLVPLNEVVILISMNMTMGTSRGMMRICYPSQLLAQITEQLDIESVQTIGARPLTAEHIHKRKAVLMNSPFKITGEIRGARISVGDLLKLNVCDILPLSRKVDDGISVCIQGLEKYIGEIGYRENKKTIQIMSIREN